MFFLFDIDSLFDGMASGIGLGVKLLVTVGLIATPIAFMKAAEGIALRCILFSIVLAMLIIELLIIGKSIKKIIGKNKKENNQNEANNTKVDLDNKTARLRRNAIIVLVSMIIISIIGYCFPLYLNLINLKFQSVPSAIVLTYFFIGIFAVLLSDYANNDNKNKIWNFIKGTIIYTFKIFIGYVLIISAIIFFIVSVIYNMGQDRDFRNTGLKNAFESFSNVLHTQIMYYDEKYAEYRPENSDIKTIVEDELYNIKYVYSKDNEIIEKLAMEDAKTKENLEYETTKLSEDPEYFFYKYLGSNLMEEEFENKVGIAIHQSSMDNTKYEDKRAFIKAYDLMYEIAYYYEFDLEKCKIIDTLQNEDEVDAKYSSYIAEYKKITK